MRKWILILFGIIILLALAGFFYSQKSSPSNLKIAPTPIHSITVVPILTPTPTSGVIFCLASDLLPTITLGVGAGNIYGALTLKNTSAQTCQILGGQFVSANYDTATVKNITITHTGQTQPQPFVLSPGETIYSQVHFPNGPQCQSIGLNQTEVTFMYKISSSDEVTFRNQNGNTNQIVQTCKSSTDMTEIQIWNMSTTPITP